MSQEGANAERACDRCRERRVKCDKRQPTCLRCEKLGKPCPGYDKKRKFVDEGVGLRKKYQAPSDRGEGGESYPEFDNGNSPAPGASSTKSAFLSPQIDSTSRITSKGSSEHARTSSYPDDAFGYIASAGNSQPDTTHSVDVVDPILYPATSYAAQAAEAEGMINDVLNDPSIDPEWFNLDPSIYYSTGDNSCGFILDPPNIIDEVDRDDLMQPHDPKDGSPMLGLDSMTDTNLWAPEVQLSTSAIIIDEREHEMAFLIRHFTEVIGPWMDLFDQDKHFGNLVPLKALRDALLRNAIAAVAAKQLGRTKGNKSYVGIQCQKPAAMEVIDDVPDIDWFYKAANYYDRAIAFSRIYLQALSGVISSPPTPNTIMTTSMANSDDLLVAVSIFSLYEGLDNLDMGWLQHLAGLKTLLDAVGADQQTQMQTTPAITVGRLASVWNFARADYQASYINHQRTFLNTEELDLWRTCGLKIQDDGSLYPNPAEVKNDPLHCREIAELVSHTLLWLVLRVMNYLASDQDETPTMRQARWLQLCSQLDEWSSNLPDTFQPCAQMRYPLPMRTSRGSSSQLTEVFFSINICAAAMQLYHFARILLLINKPMQPHETGARDAGRLKAYREVSNETTKHAHRICGIALGRPHPSVRVEMLLPLYIAGLCLEAAEERKVVLELLRAIEKDTGCSTENRCLELMREWEWSQEPENMATAY